MKNEQQLTLTLVGLGAAGLALGVFVIVVGSERMFWIGMILAVAVGIGLVLAGAALAIRAWRKSDKLIERHVYHEGRQIIKVIDNRPAALPQLPSPQMPPVGVFPELLRASYQAGLGAGTRAAPPADADAEVRELTPEEWGGEIVA